MFKFRKFLVKFLAVLLIVELSAATPLAGFNGFKELVDSVEKFKNPNADPCEDYFEYACKNKLLDREDVGVDERFSEILTRRLLEGENLNEYQLKLQNFYKSCRGDKDLPKLIKDISFTKYVGDWPMFNPNWNKSSFDWIAAQNNAPRYFVFIDASPDKEARGYKIYLSTGSSARTPQQTRDYAGILKKFGVNAEDIDDIVERMSTLDEKFDSISKIENVSDYKEDVLTFSELKEAATGIDWDAFFSILDKPLQPNDKIHIKSLKALIAIIHELKALDSKSLANYFIYRIMENFDQALRNVDFSEEYCSRLVLSYFHRIIYDVVLQDFKDKNQLLEHLKWAAEEKVIEEVVSQVYEQLFLNTSNYLQIKDYYGDLAIKNDNFLENLINIKQLIWKSYTLPQQLMPAMRTVIRILYNAENKHPMHVLITAAQKVLQDSTKPDEDRRLECIQNQLKAPRQDFAVISFIFMLDSIPLYDKVIDREFLGPSGKYYNGDEQKVLTEAGTDYKKLFFEGAFQKLICIHEPIWTENKNFFLFPYQNTDQFSKVYNCPVGSVMNPKDKCK